MNVCVHLCVIDVWRSGSRLWHGLWANSWYHVVSSAITFTCKYYVHGGHVYRMYHKPKCKDIDKLSGSIALFPGVLSCSEPVLWRTWRSTIKWRRSPSHSWRDRKSIHSAFVPRSFQHFIEVQQLKQYILFIYPLIFLLTDILCHWAMCHQKKHLQF